MSEIVYRRRSHGGPTALPGGFRVEPHLHLSEDQRQYDPAEVDRPS
jgi:hypothetical protein